MSSDLNGSAHIVAQDKDVLSVLGKFDGVQLDPTSWHDKDFYRY